MKGEGIGVKECCGEEVEKREWGVRGCCGEEVERREGEERERSEEVKSELVTLVVLCKRANGSMMLMIGHVGGSVG